ncbi:MAG TPA: biotin/lipoyl-binding protein, partial [Allosphingosinicella sp.]|nr:biotin/lipoyl-binding protein [Allosphingosinicella sp.]
MKPQRIVILVLAGLALLFLAWRLLAPQFREAPTLSGYIEGEPLYLSAAISGRVQGLAVRRGQRVPAGMRLFLIEPDQQLAQGQQAAAELAAARAQAEDARKGQRPAEL